MIKIVVPISGGKDSQMCLKLALKEYLPENIIGLFCDTKFEHPLTYKHIENLSTMYGINIVTINAGSVEESSIKNKRFPGGGARHCTDELKIKPTKKFIQELAEKQGGFEVWYGMRLDESAQRRKRYAKKVSDELYMPHEIMPGHYPKFLGEKLGIRFRLPILAWTSKIIRNELKLELNPLYGFGFDRVGCFPCMASGDKWKEKAFNFDEFGKTQFKSISIVSEKINKPIFNSAGGKEIETDPGCSICKYS
jgi:3'-phosphoadenosine 5'-phosphosulfate sulfotransferase (PAPS reductase)/FAD synthetase